MKQKERQLNVQSYILKTHKILDLPMRFMCIVCFFFQQQYVQFDMFGSVIR